MYQYLSKVFLFQPINTLKKIINTAFKISVGCVLIMSTNAAVSQVTVQAESYTAMSGVQTENTTDTGGGLNVGWIDAGDWMAYSVNLPTAGKYKVSFRVASPSGGGSFRLEKAGGGAAVYGIVNVQATGAWQNWQTITQEMTLPAGQQAIGFATISGGFNINWIQFEPVVVSSSSSSSSSAPNRAPVAVLNASSPDNPQSPSDIMACCTINASAAGSTDADGDPLTYVWEVTGGGRTWAPTGTTGVNASYRVSNLAVYTVKLTVRDGRGGESTASKSLLLYFQDYFPSSSSRSSSSSSSSSSFSSTSVCSFSVVLQAENYQSMSGVQTEATTDVGGGVNVGWIDAGDWVSYPVNLPYTGAYKVSYRVASLNGNGVIRLEQSLLSSVYSTSIPATGGWQNWVTVTQDVSTLAGGPQTLKFVAPAGGFNINWIKIEAASCSSSSGSSSSRSSSSSDRNHYNAPRAMVAPVIDGVAEAQWDRAAWAPIDVFWLGSQRPSAADFSGRYKAMWDAGNLYLLFDITDETLFDATANPLERYWDDDSVEIFIDENKNGGNHQYNTSAWAYHVSILGDTIDFTNTTSVRQLNNHITVRRVSSGSKHLWEMSVSIYGENYSDTATNIPLNLFAGKLMGFSACYNDNDASAQRESMVGSVDTLGHKNDMGYRDASVFGSMLLIE